MQLVTSQFGVLRDEQYHQIDLYCQETPTGINHAEIRSALSLWTNAVQFYLCTQPPSAIANIYFIRSSARLHTDLPFRVVVFGMLILAEKSAWSSRQRALRYV